MEEYLDYLTSFLAVQKGGQRPKVSDIRKERLAWPLLVLKTEEATSQGTGKPLEETRKQLFPKASRKGPTT
jgi:hypothetical protein